MDKITKKNGSLRHVPLQYPSLQDAIDACQDGDCVFIASGTYVLTEPLMVSKSIHILGDDSGNVNVSFDGTTLSPAVPMLRMESASARVKGIAFTMTHGPKPASDPTTACAVLISQGNPVFDQCTITASVNGVKVLASAYASLSSSQVKSSCTGIVVAQGSLFLDRCDLSDCQIGLRVLGGSTINMESSFVAGCKVGILCEGHCNGSFQKCVVESCFTGVHIEDTVPSPTPVVFSASEVKDCKRGIFLHGAGCNAEIRKNLLDSCSESAICIDNGSALICQNVIRGSGEYGVEIVNGSPTLDANAIEKSKKAGVMICGPTTMPKLTNNDIAGHTTEGSVGLVVEECAAPQIEGNVFRDNERNFVSSGGQGVVTSNEFNQSLYENIEVNNKDGFRVGGPLEICDNDIYGSKRVTAVLVREQGRCIIRGNTITGAHLSAVMLNGCANSEVSQNEILDAQDAVVAQNGAVATITQNRTELAVTVFSDAANTATVIE